MQLLQFTWISPFEFVSLYEFIAFPSEVVKNISDIASSSIRSDFLTINHLVRECKGGKYCRYAKQEYFVHRKTCQQNTSKQYTLSSQIVTLKLSQNVRPEIFLFL